MINRGLWTEFGLRNTGETYLVGQDSKLRSPSRFFIEAPDAYLNSMREIGVPLDVLNEIKAKKTSVGLQPVHSEGAQAALQGETGVGIFEDYRGIPVLSAYAPLNIPGLDWAIVAKIDEKEAFGSVWNLGKQMVIMTLVVSGILIIIAGFIGIKLAHNISQPIEEFSNIIRILATEKDLTKRVKVESDDEFGDMADALNEMLSNFQSAFQQTLDSTRTVQEKAKELEEISQHIVSGNEDYGVDEAEKISTARNELHDLSKKIEDISKHFNVL
jgi:methyl-accepting chemotaxis protein